MAVQKYPYKVTKIDWCDYISRGEINVVYKVLITSYTQNVFDINDITSDWFVQFINNENENVYILSVLKNPDIYMNPDHECIAEVTFRLPFDIPPGRYNVSFKMLSDNANEKIPYVLNTFPTNLEELQVIVLDTTTMPLTTYYKDGTVSKLPKDKLKWPDDFLGDITKL